MFIKYLHDILYGCRIFSNEIALTSSEANLMKAKIVYTVHLIMAFTKSTYMHTCLYDRLVPCLIKINITEYIPIHTYM